MGLKLSTPISLARGLLNDTRLDSQRYSDADLLAYANAAIKAIIPLAQFYFHTEGEVECEAGKCLQAIPWDNATSIVDVIGIKGGANVIEAQYLVLDAFNPGWQQLPAGAAQNWMRVQNDPMRFYVYPQAPVGQVLNVIYVKVPDDYAVTDDTGLPLTLSTAIADYIVFMAESRDDEHINSNRAAQFLASFMGRFK